MRVLAIDPGPEQSAWLWFDCESKLPVEFGIDDNRRVLFLISCWGCSNEWDARLAIEMAACYGMVVGQSIFETVFWTGRFVEAWGGEAFTLVYRLDVKMCLCHDTRAKDTNIRQALIDRFPATGGGKVPQIGVKRQPGPLYGIKSHLWAALGVAVTFAEKENADAD